MSDICETVTGEQLANAIRQRAAQIGLTLKEFARPLSPDPAAWIIQLAHAQRPKPHTAARVYALLNGEEVAAAPPNNFQASRRVAAILRSIKADEENTPAPVHREPCRCCGVRADRHDEFGCRRWIEAR